MSNEDIDYGNQGFGNGGYDTAVFTPPEDDSQDFDGNILREFGFGNLSYGNGQFGLHLGTITNDTQNLKETQRQWPYRRFAAIEDNDELKTFVRALNWSTDYIDARIAQLYDNRFIETATDEQLEKLAAEVNVTRKTGEDDTSLRYRALISKVANATDNSFRDFQSLLRVVFRDSVDDISISAVDDSPTVTITVSSAIINSLPLTKRELEQQLEKGIPPSDGINIATRGSFELGERDGYTPPKESRLGDGTLSTNIEN
jgi:hypothetical protein